MGGVDEVVREWLCHVLIHCLMFRINDWIVFATKKAEESVNASHTHTKILSHFLVNIAT